MMRHRKASMNSSPFVGVLFILILQQLPESVKAICSADDDRTVSVCLRPLLEVLQSTGTENPVAQDMEFPLFKYSPPELDLLCTSYNIVRKGCLSDRLLKRCSNLPLVAMTKSLFGFACGESRTKFAAQFSCIAKALNADDQCNALIKGRGIQPGVPLSCNNMNEFFQCARPVIEKACPKQALTIFAESVDNFGCEIDTGLCGEQEKAQISTCLSTTLAKWKIIKDSNATLAKLTFPLFSFTPQHLDLLCSSYQSALELCYPNQLRLHCRTDAIVRFAETNLNYACRVENEAFFRRFICISRTIQTNEQCAPFNTGPVAIGNEEGKCKNIPLFYNCLKNPLRQACSAEAIQVVEDAIENYDCPLQKVQDAPPPDENICNHEKDAGPCDNVFVRWFFNKETRQCEKFVYGGCSGNGNNFGTSQDCEKACKKAVNIGSDIATNQITNLEAASGLLGNPVNVRDILANNGISDQQLVSAKVVQVYRIMNEYASCNADRVSQLASCLNPLLVKWQSLQKSRTLLQSINFKVFHLSPPELDIICSTYHGDDTACYTNDLRQQCKEHPLVQLVEANFGFPCRVENEAFFRRFLCIQNVVRLSPECAPLNRAQTGQPEVGVDLKCSALPDYRGCLRKRLQSSCTDEGVDVFDEAVNSFGCLLPKLLPKVSPPPLAPQQQNSVLEPLLAPPPENGNKTAPFQRELQKVLVSTPQPKKKVNPALLEPLQQQPPISLGTFIKDLIPNPFAAAPAPEAVPAVSTNLPQTEPAVSTSNLPPAVTTIAAATTTQSPIQKAATAAQKAVPAVQNVSSAVPAKENAPVNPSFKLPSSLITSPPLDFDQPTSPKVNKPAEPAFSGDFQEVEGKASFAEQNVIARVPPPPLGQTGNGAGCPPIETCEKPACIVITTRGGCQICACDEQPLVVNPPSGVQDIAVVPITIAPPVQQQAIFPIEQNIPDLVAAPVFTAAPLTQEPPLSAKQQQEILNTRVDLPPAQPIIPKDGIIRPEQLAPADTCIKRDKQEIVECMKPLVKTWQDILKQRSQDENTLFALFKYTRREIHSLCSDYRWLHESCYTPRLLQHCSQHPFVVFIESHLSFGCVAPYNATFLNKYECLRAVTLGSNRCLELIQGLYLPGREEGKCNNMPDYYNCMQENVERQCNISGLQIFRAAIKTFGCNLPPIRQAPPPEPRLPQPVVVRLLQPIPAERSPQIPIKIFQPNSPDSPQTQFGAQPLSPDQAQRVEDGDRQLVQKIVSESRVKQVKPITTTIPPPKCEQDTAFRVRNCFSGLLDGWVIEERSRPENFTNVTFPLYLYQKQQLLDLCDAYAASFTECSHAEIKACQDDSVIKFAIENMGFPCGRNVLDFFANFDCLGDAVKALPQCLEFVRGLFHPTNADHKCDQMPDFYKCVRGGIAQCSSNGTQLFEDSIKNFGCKLDFASL